MARTKTGIHNITRTYQTKNGIVTKTYQYSTNEVNVLTKKGNISKPFLKRVYKELGFTPSVAEQLDIKATVKRLVSNYTKKDLPVNLLTPKMIKASYIHNRIEGMLVNTGFTLEEIAEQANTTVSVLTNESNWTFVNDLRVFTNEHGESYEFTFRYNGAVMEKV